MGASNCTSLTGLRMVSARSNRTRKVAYKVDDYYAPECDQGLAWDDPTLAIDWPVSSANAVLSDKDRKLGRFADLVSPFRYNDT